MSVRSSGHTCASAQSARRSQRARRAALRSLGPLPLPASLASWGGGTAIGTGVAVKAAALLAAGIAAVGTTQQAVDALTAAPALERSQPVAVRLAPAPRATPSPRAVARAAEQPAAPVRATKHRRASIAAAVEQVSIAQAEPAPAPAAAPPAAESTPPPVELPVAPVAVELPSAPPLPVALPQAVVPTVPLVPELP